LAGVENTYTLCFNLVTGTGNQQLVAFKVFDDEKHDFAAIVRLYKAVS
jgi:hypothetical protein